MDHREALYRLVLAQPDPLDAERLSPVLAEAAPWGWEEREGASGSELRIHCHSLEHLERARQRLLAEMPGAEARIEAVPAVSWETAWRSYFRPKRVAEAFLVLPSWEDDTGAGGLIPLRIEPKMAFGTGHHETTALCLEALVALKEQGWAAPGATFLDLGTGSGILGIAAALLGLKGIGLDIDPVAVDNAAENSGLNLTTQRLLLAVGSLECLNPARRFQLIVANILAEPLLGLAPALARHLDDRGVLVLSGLLREQEQRLLEAYTAQGLTQRKVKRRGHWTALLLGRSPDLSRP